MGQPIPYPNKGPKGDTGNTGAPGAGATSHGIMLASAPPATAPTSTLLYANNSGNDSTGNGSAGSPFRTLTKALTMYERLTRGDRMDIDCTGLTETLPTFARIPIFDSDLPTCLNGSATVWWRARLGAVNVFAMPTTETTIASNEIVSQTADVDHKSLIITHTHAGITVDSLVGKLIWGTGGVIPGGTQPQVATVQANTDTTITVNWSHTRSGPMIGPIMIGVPSCVLTNVGNTRCMDTGIQRAGLTFSGVKFVSLNDGPSFSNAVDGSGRATLGDRIDSLHLVGCQLQGMEITGDNGVVSVEGCTFNGNEGIGRGGFYLCAQQVIVGQSRFRRISDFGAIATTRGIVGRLQWNASELSACACIGAWGRPGQPEQYLGMYYTGGTQITDSWLHDGVGPETQVFGYGAVRLDLVNVRIDNCSPSSGGAIDLRLGVRGSLNHVTGSGSQNFALYLHNGDVMEATTDTTITANEGDIKVGDNSPISWATFVQSAGYETDTRKLAALVRI